MGTETSYPIGTILTKRVPEGNALDELRVVGGGKHLVVTSNKEFGESYPMNADIARREYTTDVPDSVLLSQPTYVNPGPTPEEVFSGESAAGDGLSRTERAELRRRESEDPRTSLESARTDTGVPVVVSEVVTPLSNATTEPAPTVSEAVPTVTEPTPTEVVIEQVTEPPVAEPAAPAKRGPGRPRKKA